VAGESIRTSILHALFDGMKNDNSVFVLGEGSRVKYSLDYPDILNSYPDRVITAPVCEGGIVGVALGASLGGLRPVVDLTFSDLTLRAMDEIINHVSKVHFMSAGKLNARIVIRADFNRPENAQSGNRLEAFFLHFPGLVVLVPSNPTDAYQMMRYALRASNPVLFFEDRVIPRGGDIPRSQRNLSVGKARVVRSGRDLTIVSYGYALHLVKEAVEGLGSVEIIDLRSLNPLDMGTVAASVRKTRRLLIVEADPVKMGIGAEISATISVTLFGKLRAPVLRVGAPDLLMPAAVSLQKYALPNVSEIRDAVDDLLSKGRRGAGAQ